MLLKIRLLVLGLLSVMAIGAIASTSAMAEPGPFWYNKVSGAQHKVGNQQAAVAFEGEGSGTELTGKIGKEEFKIKCNIKAKGQVWNGNNQGQGKVKTISYEACVSNNIEGCHATVKPSANGYDVWLDWKYAGLAKELENKPQIKEQGQKEDIVLLPGGVGFKVNAAKTELEPTQKASFAEVKFGSVEECKVVGALGGKADGATAAEINPAGGTFTKEPKLVFPGGVPKQHDWEAVFLGFLPFPAQLLFASNEAKFSGELPIKFGTEEVAIFEK